MANMLQNACKTLGFKKNMVYKIPPGGGGKPYPASGLFKEKFDVLRMFPLFVSSRYRRVRKMQLHLVVFALFIYTIFKEDISPVICVHGPHLRG